MPNLKSLIVFIRSTFQEPTDFIPLHDPRFIGNEKKYLDECIDSNFVSGVGEFVRCFEGNQVNQNHRGLPQIINLYTN